MKFNLNFFENHDFAIILIMNRFLENVPALYSLDEKTNISPTIYEVHLQL